VDTLAYLQERYPEHEFSVIMGSDSYLNLPKWKNYQWLLSNYSIYVYCRSDHEKLPQYPGARNVQIMDAPVLPISSTDIRGKIKARQSVRYLLPESVLEEIEKSGYYRNIR
ncbi:MAG TPA: nicotinic acid mononucleotide adenylyltransferase, partial [Puia sp.]|nr:nicotinic acid mononucleotide adenylyltransferase [Puia sp.]